MSKELAKDKDRQQIAADVETFLASGGAIKLCTHLDNASYRNNIKMTKKEAITKRKVETTILLENRKIMLPYT